MKEAKCKVVLCNSFSEEVRVRDGGAVVAGEPLVSPDDQPQGFPPGSGTSHMVAFSGQSLASLPSAALPASVETPPPPHRHSRWGAWLLEVSSLGTDD